MIPASDSRGVSAGQPAWLVISPGITGTSVHWSGLTASTSSTRSGPRIAFDVVFDAPSQRRQLLGDLVDVRRW